MVTTFYPPYHYGGDATYVQRLVDALTARGHQVDVIHCRDSYYLANPQEPEPGRPAPAGARIFPLKSRFGKLSPLLTHQTGRPWLKPDIRRRLAGGGYDVIHFHNASLIGPGAFSYGDAVKLYTTHEHWLLCPLSLLWKKDRELCDSRECVSCTLRAGRPPQWWRYGSYLQRQLQHIDRFISPSRFTRDKHREWGLDLPFDVLPSFTTAPSVAPVARPHERPYFLFVGRLIKIKGLHTILRTFARYPDADLVVAGTGGHESELRALASDLPSVRFVGAQSSEQLQRLYRHAIALIMPSIAYEVFGLVLIEAFAEGTPALVRNLGGMAEVATDSGAGILFDTDEGLLDGMRQLQTDQAVRARLGENGRTAFERMYSEDVHIRGYLSIVERARLERSTRRKSPP